MYEVRDYMSGKVKHLNDAEFADYIRSKFDNCRIAYLTIRAYEGMRCGDRMMELDSMIMARVEKIED